MKPLVTQPIKSKTGIIRQITTPSLPAAASPCAWCCLFLPVHSAAAAGQWNERVCALQDFGRGRWQRSGRGMFDVAAAAFHVGGGEDGVLMLCQWREGGTTLSQHRRRDVHPFQQALKGGAGIQEINAN
jgi:hypothetical protein